METETFVSPDPVTLTDRQLAERNYDLLCSLRKDLDFVVNEIQPLLGGLANSPIVKMMGLK